MAAHGFPSEITYTHPFELQIHRYNTAGRQLTTLTPMKSHDRGEIEAEVARRLENTGGKPMRGTRFEIVERKKFRPPVEQ